MDWLSGSAPFVMWGAIIVFNIAIIQLLRTCLVGIDIQAALSEKGPVAVVQTSMTKQTVPTDAGGQLQTEEKKEKQSTTPEALTDVGKMLRTKESKYWKL